MIGGYDGNYLDDVENEESLQDKVQRLQAENEQFKLQDAENKQVISDLRAKIVEMEKDKKRDKLKNSRLVKKVKRLEKIRPKEAHMLNKMVEAITQLTKQDITLKFRYDSATKFQEVMIHFATFFGKKNINKTHLKMVTKTAYENSLFFTLRDPSFLN